MVVVVEMDVVVARAVVVVERAVVDAVCTVVVDFWQLHNHYTQTPPVHPKHSGDDHNGCQINGCRESRRPEKPIQSTSGGCFVQTYKI